MDTKIDTIYIDANDAFGEAFSRYIAFLDTFYFVLPAEVDEKGTTCA